MSCVWAYHAKGDSSLAYSLGMHHLEDSVHLHGFYIHQALSVNLSQKTFTEHEIPWPVTKAAFWFSGFFIQKLKSEALQCGFLSLAQLVTGNVHLKAWRPTAMLPVVSSDLSLKQSASLHLSWMAVISSRFPGTINQILFMGLRQFCLGSY